MPGRLIKPGTPRFLQDHFVNVAIIVHGYAEMIVFRHAQLFTMKLYLKYGSPISSNDCLSYLLAAQHRGNIISLPVYHIPGEGQIGLRWVACRGSRSFAVKESRRHNRPRSLE